MCQGLPLGCLHLLDGLYGVGHKLWLQCAILHFLLEHQIVLIIFALSSYTNCLFFLILVEFSKYNKYGECSDYYRLFCFRQILFLMPSLLVLMKLSIYISGLSHEKLHYSRHNAKTKYELVCNSTQSSDFLYYTNGSHEGFVEFCVIEVFKFWFILRWMKE